MEKELKEVLEKSSAALGKLQAKVEEYTDDFADDAAELWADLKSKFAGIDEKIKTASENLDQKSDEATLQAQLGAMEAHDKLVHMKDTVESFAHKVSAKAQTELDMAALKAHLAKLEAEDFWESKGSDLTRDFHESKEKVQKIAIDATSEIKDYFEKLADTITKKS